MKTKQLIICLILITVLSFISCKKTCGKEKDNQTNTNEENNATLNYEDIFVYDYDFDTSTYRIIQVKEQYQNLTSYEVPSSFDGVPIEFKYNYEFYLKDKDYFITEYNNGQYLGNSDNPYLVLVDILYKNISSFVIHESTKIIGQGVFDYCYNLEKIDIHDNIEYIDFNEFISCKSLKTISIPDEWVNLWNSGYTEKGNQILSNIIDGLFKLNQLNSLDNTGLKFTIYNGWIYFGTNINPYYCLYNSTPEENTSTLIHEDTIIIDIFYLSENIEPFDFIIPSKVEYIKYIDITDKSGNSKIKSIYIPTSVKKISTSTFMGIKCDITVSEDNPYYKSMEGSIYSKDGKKLLYYNLKNVDKKIIYLPDTLEEIYPGAFRGNDTDYSTISKIQEIIIPNNVKHIGEYAFPESINVKQLKIPEKVKILNNITGLYMLETIELSKNVVQVDYLSAKEIYYEGSLDDYCHIYTIDSFFPYKDCKFYYKNDDNNYVLAQDIDLVIPKDITYIYAYQFINCSFLKSIKLHSNITDVDYAAFYGCDNLEYSVYQNANYLGIGNNKYAILISVIDKTAPTIEIHPDTQIIQDGAFYGCEKIKTVTIPSNVKKIGTGAFNLCFNLKEIIFEPNENEVKLGDGIYRFIVSVEPLEKIVLPKFSNSINVIDGNISKNVYYPGTALEWIESYPGINNSFYYSSNPMNFYCLNDNGEYAIVEKLELTDEIEVINKSYNLCFPKLTELEVTPNVKYIYDIPTKSLYIPSTVLGVTSQNGPKILYFESDNPQWYLVPNEQQTEQNKTYYTGVSRNDIVNINGMEFVIEDNFATLACYKGKESIVNIPSTIERDNQTYVVNKIGSYAFIDCEHIQSIYIPSTVNRILDLAFSNLNAYIYCEQEIPYINEANWGFSNYKVYYNNINKSKFVIDDICYNIIADNAVETISYFGNDASITIPSVIEIDDRIYQVIKIGDYTFKNNSKVETVRLSENITEIGEYAFYNCTNLININIDKITSFGSYSFYNCTNAKIEQLSSHTYMVGKYAFFNNKHIKHININSVDDSSFEGCINLETVTISNGANKIGIQAFKDCINLKTVTLSNDVKSIGGQAFKNCTNLNSINIPEKLEYLGDYAFDNCTSLESVELPVTLRFLHEHAFFNCPNITIYVANEKMYAKYDGHLKKNYSIFINSYNPDMYFYSGYAYTYHELIIKTE